MSATGDDTLRSRVIDIVRGLDFWPLRYNLRTLRSGAADRWYGKEAELRTVAEAEIARYADAAAKGDVSTVTPIVGEGVGLIHGIAPAGTVLRTMIAEAEDILRCKVPKWIAV